MKIKIYVNHSKLAISLGVKHGWFPGARYTNLRDVRSYPLSGKGFVDIDWKNYNFNRHFDVVSENKPFLTVARDLESIKQLDLVLKEAELLLKFSKNVAIVPKDPLLKNRLTELIPKKFMLAYSVPTRYGGTKVPIESFDRPVHLLGGRPEMQRQIANNLQVVSIDSNRFTFDARYGDYFDGEIFRPHPKGGYKNCLLDSIRNITSLWSDYNPSFSRNQKLRKAA